MYANTKAITKLQEAAKACNLDNASFSHDEAEDARIKNAVNLYVTTWIEGRIQAALAEMGIETTYSPHFMRTDFAAPAPENN